MTTTTSTPNPLDEALTRLINRSIDAAESVAGGISEASGDAAAFLVAEIPDVIQQLLVWHAIESLIWFLPGKEHVAELLEWVKRMKSLGGTVKVGVV